MGNNTSKIRKPRINSADIYNTLDTSLSNMMLHPSIFGDNADLMLEWLWKLQQMHIGDGYMLGRKMMDNFRATSLEDAKKWWHMCKTIANAVVKHDNQISAHGSMLKLLTENISLYAYQTKRSNQIAGNTTTTILQELLKANSGLIRFFEGLDVIKSSMDSSARGKIHLAMGFGVAEAMIAMYKELGIWNMLCKALKTDSKEHVILMMAPIIDEKWEYKCDICGNVQWYCWQIDGEVKYGNTCSCKEAQMSRAATLFSQEMDKILMEVLMNIPSMLWSIIFINLIQIVISCRVQYTYISGNKGVRQYANIGILDTLTGLLDTANCGLNSKRNLEGSILAIPAQYVSLALFINYGMCPRMCKEGNCICQDSMFGDQLKEHALEVKPLLTKMMEHGLMGTYGECTAALSHCWGDMLLLNPDELVSAVEPMMVQKERLWVDLSQEYFDAERCRKEYSGKVYVLSKPVYKYGHMLDINEALAVAALSDWGERGWVAQEVNEATSLHFITQKVEGDFKLSIDTQELTTDIAACLGKNTHDYPQMYFADIVSRKWRNKEDVILSNAWWGKGVVTVDDIVASALLSSNSNVESRTYCWLPSQCDGIMYKTPKLKKQLTSKGHIMLHGDMRCISVVDLIDKVPDMIQYAQLGTMALTAITAEASHIIVHRVECEDKTGALLIGVRKMGNIWHTSSVHNCFFDADITWFDNKGACKINKAIIGHIPEWIPKPQHW